MFLSGDYMNPVELVMSWLLWHQAAAFLQHDKSLVESAPVRFPKEYGMILQRLGQQANHKAQEAYRQLRRAGISILGKKVDRGELFLMWKHRGQTELLRILEAKLRAEVQKKVDELMENLTEQT